MSDLPALLGSDLTFRAVDPRDDVEKEWTWSPLTLGDEADMEIALRDLLSDRIDFLTSIKETAAGFDGADRKVILECAVQEQMRLMKLGAIDLLREFKLPEADAVHARFHMRKHHPDLTHEDVMALMKQETFAEISRKQLELLRSVLPGEASWPRFEGTSASPDETAGQAETGTKGATAPPTGS